MSNLLQMAKFQSILSLDGQGWPARRIARELGIDREAVRKYVLEQMCEPKPADLPNQPSPIVRRSWPASRPGFRRCEFI